MPLEQRLEKVSRVVEAWWTRWKEAAFVMFTPRLKWLHKHRNVQPGDVVLLASPRKLQAPLYQLAKVKATHPDELGVVRTLTLELRDKRRRGQLAVRELRMAVQRVAVILPVEESWQGGLVNVA